MVQKMFLVPYGLQDDLQSVDGPPPLYSKQDEANHTQSFGSAVATSPTNTKPTILATEYQLPLVPLINQDGGDTEIPYATSDPEPSISISGSSTISPLQPLISELTPSSLFWSLKPDLEDTPVNETPGLSQSASSLAQITSESQSRGPSVGSDQDITGEYRLVQKHSMYPASCIMSQL
jgi:hypothetical protein